jgi:Tfp pilus assembly protein PilW
MMRGIMRRLRADERGLSMTELLVASALTLVIMAMVGTMFIQTIRVTTASNQTRTSTAIAGNVVNSISTVLRVATPLAKANTAQPDPAVVAGEKDSLTVYSLTNANPANPAPFKVTFALDDDGVLTETRCPAQASSIYWVFPSCTGVTTVRTITEGLIGDAGVPLFTYIDVNGAEIAVGDGTLSLTQRRAVVAVRISVTAQATGTETDPVVIENTVVLRNLGLELDS